MLPSVHFLSFALQIQRPRINKIIKNLGENPGSVQSRFSCYLCTDAGHAVVIGPHAFLLDGFLARVLLCFIDILVAFLAEDFVSRYANGTARATVRVEP